MSTKTAGTSQVAMLPMLAIELSQRAGGAAVRTTDGATYNCGFEGGRRDRDDVLPGIESALRESGVRTSSLAAVAVDVGPGGFTGLRISIAAAQAIAEAASAVVIAVPAALVAAESTPSLSTKRGVIIVCAAAKAGTVWCTQLTRATVEDPWRILGEPGIVDRLVCESTPSALLADEHVDASMLEAFRGAGIPIDEPVFRASAVADIALSGGRDVRIFSDPSMLLPLYPRAPEAVRKWQERPSR
jgi:tRNA threonylcarbamoyladenosine biosynthesis protein TsaB